MIIPTIGRVEQSYPLTIMLVVVHCHWGGGRRRGGGGNKEYMQWAVERDCLVQD